MSGINKLFAALLALLVSVSGAGVVAAGTAQSADTVDVTLTLDTTPGGDEMFIEGRLNGETSPHTDAVKRLAYEGATVEDGVVTYEALTSSDTLEIAAMDIVSGTVETVTVDISQTGSQSYTLTTANTDNTVTVDVTEHQPATPEPTTDETTTDSTETVTNTSTTDDSLFGGAGGDELDGTAPVGVLVALVALFGIGLLVVRW